MAAFVRRIGKLSYQDLIRWVIRWLVYLFVGATIFSFGVWLLGEIPFTPPFLDWFTHFLEWVDGFSQNFGTEMLGALLTFVLIEHIIGTREKEESEQAEEARKQEIKEHVDQALVRYQETLDEQEKRALINQLSSTVPGFAAEAVRLLRHKGWLEVKDIAEGLRAGGDFHLADLRDVVLDEEDLKFAKLSQASLGGAKLEGANLWKANLKGVYLGFAHLEGVYLAESHLEGANLAESHLEGANLISANLKGANLFQANLKGANLISANLEGANLISANLKGAMITVEQLTQAELLESTILPDGTELPGRDFEEWLQGPISDEWHETFEEWCKTVPVDRLGFIIRR